MDGGSPSEMKALAIASLGTHGSRRIDLDLDHNRGELKLLSKAFGDGPEGHVEVRLGHESDDVVEHDCLPLASLGLLSLAALTGRQLARDDRDDEEEEQPDPLDGVGDCERVPRVGEEPVVDEEGGNRGQNRGPVTEGDGRGKHGDQVEHRHVAEV